VVVLDLMLPGIDGMEVCRRIRTFSDANVIILTAKSDEVDKLVGLSVGADDYLTKPFSPRELVARLRGMLRRPRSTRSEPAAQGRRFGALEIDPAGRDVRVAGYPVEMTRTEFDLLDTLGAEPRVVFSRRQLLEYVWGGDWYATTTSSTCTSATCATCSTTTPHPRYIRTVGGVGYRMGRG
jgi:DNA-binding response OmpR family regulator